MTQLNEPPTKWVAYKGKEAESLFVSPILEVTVEPFKNIDIVAT